MRTKPTAFFCGNVLQSLAGQSHHSWQTVGTLWEIRSNFFLNGTNLVKGPVRLLTQRLSPVSKSSTNLAYLRAHNVYDERCESGLTSHLKGLRRNKQV